MPWHLENDNAKCSGWAVVKDDDGKVVGCHPTKAKALAQLAALNANVKGEQMDGQQEHGGRGPASDESAWDANKAMSACSSAADYNAICAGKTDGDPAMRSSHKLPHHYLGKPANIAGVRAARQRFGQTTGLTNREEARRHLFETHTLESDRGRSLEELELEAREARPTFPRENIVRAIGAGVQYEVREAEDGGGASPILNGHLAVFDEWTEIDSLFEGHFLERVRPGAFKRTFRENRDRIKPTFNHGHDPDMGDKVLGPTRVLEEDSVGARYEVPLFPSVPPLIVEGLREGVYGSSFRFRVRGEEINEDPGPSDHNPKGLPERSITDVHLFEFGPVTFPQYVGADAGVRSLTDDEIVRMLLHDPARLRHIIEGVTDVTPIPTPTSEVTPAADPRKSAGHQPEPPPRFRTQEEWLEWLTRS